MSYINSIPQIPSDLTKYINTPLSEVPEIIAFGNELKTVCNNNHPNFADILSAQTRALAQSIDRKIQKVSKALDEPNATLTKELISRIQSLAKACDTFKELVKNKQHLRTSSEVIFPHLMAPDFRKSIRKDCLSDETSAYFNHEAKQSLSASREFLQRVHNESYGVKAKARILDPSENTLYAQESFLRLLFLDMVMQNMNPAEHTEWFKGQSSDTFKAAHDEIEKLRKEPSIERDGKILLSGKLLTKALNDKISLAAAQAVLPRNKYALVLEYLRIYFSPTSKELSHTLSLLLSKEINEALILAKSLITDTDRTQLLSALKAIYSKNPEVAQAFVTSLKDDQSDLFAHCQSQLMIFSLEEANAIDIPKHLSQLAEISNTVYCEDALEALIAKVVSPTLAENEQMMIFEQIVIQESTLSLRRFIDKHIPFDTPLSQLEPYAKTIRSLLDKCVAKKELYEHGLATLAIYYVTSSDEPKICDKFFTLYSGISSAKERRMVLEKVGIYLCFKFKPEEVVSALQVFCTRISSQKDKSHLLKLTSYILASTNTETAKTVARLISEKGKKAHTLDLINYIKPQKKTSISVHTFGISPDQATNFPADLLSHILNHIT